MIKKDFLSKIQQEVASRYSEYKLQRPVLHSRCPKKRPPFQFELYQLFLKDFVRPDNDLFGKGLLIVHSVGSGKTCGALSTIRNFGNNFVWVTRTTLVQDPIKDLRNCGGITLDELGGTQRWFMSYKQFANALRCENSVGREWYLEAGGGRRLAGEKMPSALSIQRRECRDDTIDPLKGKLIVIDEAHNLFDSQKANHLTPEIVQDIVDMIHRSYELSQQSSCRLLLLSATPMRKDAMTLPKLLNMLIPSPSKRLPVTKEAFLHRYILSDGKLNREKFCASACGLISYLDVRGDLTRFPRREIEKPKNVPIGETQLLRYNACKASLCHSRIEKLTVSIAKKKALLKKKKRTLLQRKKKQHTTNGDEAIEKLEDSVKDLKQQIEEKQNRLEKLRNELDSCVEREGRQRVYCMRRVLNFSVPLSAKEEETGRVGRGRQSLPRSWRPDMTTKDDEVSLPKMLTAAEREEQGEVDIELMELKELERLGVLKIERDETSIFDPETVLEQIDSSSPKLEALLEQLSKVLKKQRRSRHMLFSDLSRFGAMVIAAGLKARGYPEVRFNPQTDLRDWNREWKAARETHRMIDWSMMFDFSEVRKTPNKPAFILLTSASLHYMGGRQLGKTRRQALITYYNTQNNLPKDAWPRIDMVVLDGGFKEGIDLLETNHVWLFEPPVTRSDFEQIVGRVLRRCAHRSKPFGKYGWKVTIHTFRIVNDGRVLAEEPMELMQPPAERNMIRELTRAMKEVAIDRLLFEEFMEAGEWKRPEKKPAKKPQVCGIEILEKLSLDQLRTAAELLGLKTTGTRYALCKRIGHNVNDRCHESGTVHYRWKDVIPDVCVYVPQIPANLWVSCKKLPGKCPSWCKQYDSADQCNTRQDVCEWKTVRGKGTCQNKKRKITGLKSMKQLIREAINAHPDRQASLPAIAKWIYEHRYDHVKYKSSWTGAVYTTVYNNKQLFEEIPATKPKKYRIKK